MNLSLPGTHWAQVNGHRPGLARGHPSCLNWGSLGVLVRRAGAVTASAGLFTLAAMHVAWGAGSAWPFPDRSALADAVIGAEHVPGPAPCFTVGTALAAAGALTAGWPAGRPLLRRLGACGAASVLAALGVLGLAGRTRLVSAASVSENFVRLDRRLYSPLCLALAGLSALSVLPDHSSGAGA